MRSTVEARISPFLRSIRRSRLVAEMVTPLAGIDEPVERESPDGAPETNARRGGAALSSSRPSKRSPPRYSSSAFAEKVALARYFDHHPAFSAFTTPLPQ